jgi:hypothetical protein
MATSATNTLENMGQSRAMKVIAQMAVEHFVNSTVMVQLVSRALQKEFAEKGDTITYKKPQRSVVLDGPDITNQIQSTSQQTGEMVVDKWKTVNFEWGAKELGLTPAAFFKEVMADPMSKLPNQVDMDLLALYNEVYHVRGNAGGSIDFADVIDSGVEMQQMGVPGDLNLVLAPTDQGELLKDLKGVFLPEFVKGIVKKAQLGRLGLFQTFMDTNVKQHTQATLADYVVNEDGGMSEGDTTMEIDGGSGTPAVGDVFYVGAVNAVNPMSYESTARLKRFTVTSYAGTAVTFTPAMRSTGAYQNVDALPVSEAAVTFEGSHTANMGFSKSAFSLATVPIKPIDGLNQTRVSHKGIQMALASDGDIKTYKSVKRLDIHYGVDASYPEHAMRLMG